MLSYQHIYHAGNFADVQKHALLCRLLTALAVKEKPFFVLDAFAGRGGYELSSAEAQKVGEYHSGIERVGFDSTAPVTLRPYLDAVAAYNSDADSLVRYPGSPWLIRHFLRPQDRMTLCELHPAEFEALRRVIPSERRRIQLCKQDALEGIRANLPPKERRGMLLIDPSYENKQEYETIADAVMATYKHWREGVYAIWYPILSAGRHEVLRNKLKRSGIRKILDCTLSIDDEREGMFGSGMIVINPPWKVKEEMAQITPWLWQKLSTEGRGSHQVRWLVPE